MSDESTSLQKSFLLSEPSSLRRRRGPIVATTVAIQVEVRLRGSLASSLIPRWKSFEGGTGCYIYIYKYCCIVTTNFLMNELASTCLKQLCGAAVLPVSARYSSQENGDWRAWAGAVMDDPFGLLPVNIAECLGVTLVSPSSFCLILSLFWYLFKHTSLQKSLMTELLVIWNGWPRMASPHSMHAPFRNSKRQASEQKAFRPFFNWRT